MTGETKTRWTEADAAALSHCWDWFHLHAGQRLQMFNFFSVTTAFLVAALVGAHGDQAHRLAAAVAVVGIGASAAFNLLERRTRSLVKAAEVALEDLERRLAAATGIESTRLVEAVERPAHRLTKYSTVLNVFHIGAAISWAVVAVAEMCQME